MIGDGTRNHDSRQNLSGSEIRQPGLPYERRRPGRVEIENQHLIRLLRRPEGQSDESTIPPPLADPVANLPPARGMLAIALAAGLFWAIMLVALWLP